MTKDQRPTTQDQSGQGLLEAIISLAIIGTGIIGVMNLVVSNQSASTEGGERVLAASLTREAVEVVRNLRDSNWLSRSAWDQGLSGTGSDYTAAALFDKSNNSWSLDFTPNDLTHNYARLWREGGVYFQSTQDSPAGASLSGYRRLLTLDAICQNKTIMTSGSSCAAGNPKIGIRVQSEVQWTTRGATHTIVAEERLFNWR
jgi:Tfp pilus assembly protein PilV